MSDFAELHAVLDTDFLIKTCTVNKDSFHLIDIIDLISPSLKKCCHEQIYKELSVHNIDAYNWINNKISNYEVRIYSDKEILEGFKSHYEISEAITCRYYVNMLKKICIQHNPKIYIEFTEHLSTFVSIDRTISDFLLFLSNEETLLGEGNGLGEVKDNLLVKYINISTLSKVYKFCSDDQNARFSILAYSSDNDLDLWCYSPFSLFYVAYKKKLIDMNTLEQLFNSWKLTFFGSQNIQIASRINKSGEFIYDRVTPDFLYNNIINDKMVLLRDGFLCYLSAIQENKKGN